MPHSIISSTGSDHGSFTHSSFGDATMSSRLNLDQSSRKIAELRSTAKKYGRWAQRPTPNPDYVINTSAIGRAFPNYSSGSSDSSSSFSLDLGRAPLQNKTHTNTLNNRSKSPILDALRPPSSHKENIPFRQEHSQHSRDSTRHTNTIHASNTPPKEPKENQPLQAEHSHQPLFTPQQQRTRAEMQPRVDDDSQNSIIMPHRNSRFQVASPNVSTRRQAPFQQPTQYLAPTQPTQHSTQSPAQPISPTQHSFAVPATTTSNSATMDNGVPVTTQGGRVRARRNSKALVQAASFGPVHSIPMPDEEEEIYLLIELLKGRVLRVEAENKELKGLQEDREQLIMKCDELKELNGQTEVAYRQLQLDFEQIKMSYARSDAKHRHLEAEMAQMGDELEELKKSHFSLEAENKRLGEKLISDQAWEKKIEEVEQLARMEKAHHATEVRDFQELLAAVDVPKYYSNSRRQNKHAHKPAEQPIDGQTQEPTVSDNVPQHHSNSQRRNKQLTEQPTQKPVAKKPATLSASARHVLDSLCPEHNAKNCMLCTRVTSFGDKTTGGAPIRSTRPIPVSKRMPVATPYEDEPTIRPSVEPSLALSTVINGLEDEIAHLKMRHSEVQKQYNNLDASLGKRERRRVGKELESLFQQLEFKGDQLYGLYDVMEGIQE